MKQNITKTNCTTTLKRGVRSMMEMTTQDMTIIDQGTYEWLEPATESGSK